MIQRIFKIQSILASFGVIHVISINLITPVHTDALDHPQNYRVCWRGSRPSPVRVSNKQSMQKLESKNKSIETRVRQTRLDVF
jgi:hypothetical protein